jgi:hypothetical protein
MITFKEFISEVNSLKRSDGRVVRDLVKFNLSSTRHTVTNAHHFTNTNDERHDADQGGHRKYYYQSSHKKDDDE